MKFVAHHMLLRPIHALVVPTMLTLFPAFPAFGQSDVWEQREGGLSLVGRIPQQPIWTGSEMIVWGGYSIRFSPNYLLLRYGDGARYSPDRAGWKSISAANAPSARHSHTMVWTGNEMIVWGGSDLFGPKRDGARYNPVTDLWSAISTNGAPGPRESHCAIWTGSEMIVWGGGKNDGGRYNPLTDTWTSLATNGAPSARSAATAAWTGSEMIVWGGVSNNVPVRTGGRYNPATGVWSPVSVSNAPSARLGHTATWTGAEMIIWGGAPGIAFGGLNDGARYNPISDSWTPMSTNGAPAQREWHAASWTGKEMVIWGGDYADISYSYFGNGGRYDPVSDTWTALSTNSAPTRRTSPGAVWAGSEMVIWGGYDGTNYLNTGARYDPSADQWNSTKVVPARSAHTSVWTGKEIIIWGGITGGDPDVGWAYDPSFNSWLGISNSNAPSGRRNHTAVWTGSEMIIWGGYSGNSSLSNGCRYNRSLNMWTALPTNGAPTRRSEHTAIWTGTQMIIWGGWTSSSSPASGGARYDFAADVWFPIATNGAPSARGGHSAIWTGQEMIVWGGANSTVRFNDGARYNPTTDTWLPVAVFGAPSKRANHTAVWTGTEMLIWGGIDDLYLGDGARYNPQNNAWATLSNSDAPEGRSHHAAVWTGLEMIIWGGTRFSGDQQMLDNGGRYDPLTDHWYSISTNNPPRGRRYHTARWTGDRLIIFGGDAFTLLCDNHAYYPYGPPLRIEQAGVGSVNLAWPYPFVGYELERTSSLTAGSWTAVSNISVQIRDEWRTTVLALPSAGEFFRLRQ